MTFSKEPCIALSFRRRRFRIFRCLLEIFLPHSSNRITCRILKYSLSLSSGKESFLRVWAFALNFLFTPKKQAGKQSKSVLNREPEENANGFPQSLSSYLRLAIEYRATPIAPMPRVKVVKCKNKNFPLIWCLLNSISEHCSRTGLCGQGLS